MDEANHTAAAIKVQDARQRFLDNLYEKDGRHEKTHAQHGVYTGLYQQYITALEEG